MLRRFSTISCVIVAACLGLATSGVTVLLGATSPLEAQRTRQAQPTQQDVCARPQPGSQILEPAELRSHDGILETDLSIHDEKLPDGTVRYCYQTPDGKVSPTLRLKPGEYRLRIPDDAAPGLYWYHPHLHGLSKTQVLGGASGALIVEGIERADPSLAGLPERLLVIRDQDLVNPDAPPSKFEPPSTSKSQLD